VVGQLRPERQRTDAREAPSDDPEVECRDRESGRRARERRAPAREHYGQHAGPRERDRDVRWDSRGEEPQSLAFAREHEGAGGERRLERIATGGERVHGRGDAAEQRSGTARDERVGEQLSAGSGHGGHGYDDAVAATDSLQTLLERAFPDAREVAVLDRTGGGDHFQVTVASPRFDGLSLVEQHRLVYDALAEPLADGTIHELRIKTKGTG
jgi:stress-induced morphogen